MAVLDVYNLEKEKVAEIQVSDGIFDVAIKGHVLHQVVIGQLANRRTGSASTQTRSMVTTSSRKLYRQKGTGRARVGDNSSPTRKGGGVAFGPGGQNFGHKIPKKLRKAALRMALTDKRVGDRLFVIEDFSLPEIRTKLFVETMKRFDVSKALIVTRSPSNNLEKSSRNVPKIKVLRYEGLNVYDVLKYEYLFLERPSIEKIEEALVS